MLRSCAGAVVRGAWLLVVLSGCGRSDQVDAVAVRNTVLSSAHGEKVALDTIMGRRATLFFVLAPDCPLCLNYAPYLASFPDRAGDVRAVGIFPSRFMDRDSVRLFAKAHHIRMPLLMDPDCMFVGLLGARVTPEVFLMTDAGDLVYHGAIDNWATRPGRKRVAASAHYLTDALSAFAQNRPPPRRDVKAVGCFIEYP
ncbi:MAG: redoxin family protein [Flavobacteriales bacterium]|nr:redoxin family protein [Flavobacteriales bacterium]MCB9193980.1 redoxin family protein [Flavobacteriales bacterium]